MTHWLRKALPKSEIGSTIAGKIEDADERIANLKEQILAVQARRAELEEEARIVASDAVHEDELERLISQNNEAAVLASSKLSASILHADLLRLFVVSGPFLSELVQPEMEKARAIHDNITRWLSRF